MKIELIYSHGSNCSQRVLWALRFKKIPHTVIESNSLSEDELLRLSPYKKVPSLLINGKPVAESMAILELLEEMFPRPRLLPQDPFERAKVREVAEMVNGTIHAVQCSNVPRFFMNHLSDEEVLTRRKLWIDKTLPPLQNLLFHESRFALRNEFSLADIFVIPIFAKGLALGLEPSSYPQFVEHVSFCLSYQDIKESCPEDLLAIFLKLNC